MESIRKFAEVLKEEQAKSGMTNLKLAQVTGLTLNTIDKLRAGDRLNPTRSTLWAISQALGIPVSRLF